MMVTFFGKVSTVAFIPFFTMRAALKTVRLAFLSAIVVVSAHAAPPSQVGNSFAVLTWNSTTLTEDILYLSTDGTCKLLSSVTSSPVSAPVYQPSATGTYTYTLNPSNPEEATLTVAIPGLNQISQVLDFSSNTSGGGATFSFAFYLGASNSFLANVSNRVTLRTGDTAITGFVVTGNAPRLVLVRAVGPTLANFSVNPVSKTPQFAIYNASGQELEIGQKWSLVTNPTLNSGIPQSQYDAQAMGWIFNIAGAFPLIENSNDEVYFDVLPPGAYTVTVTDSTVGASGGTALVEVYILSFSS